MKDVLVILATYNGERFLTAQLDSVLRQTSVNVKILARDDGSVDATQSILEKYRRAGKLEWYQGEHLNVAKGFFDLMKKAAAYETDFVAFCDQDDVWDDDKLAVAVDRLSKYDRSIPALYYSGQRLVDENLNFIEDHILNKKRTLKTRFVLSDFAGCTGVFNRSLLNEVLRFEPDYMFMHDSWLSRVCTCVGGKVEVDPMPHMSYRQHSGNTLGLGHSVGATLTQVRRYLFDYKIEKLVTELLRGYGDRMTPEYRELSNWICGYRENSRYRRLLLDRRHVDFCSRGLNLVYWLKVMTNNL